MDEKILVDFRLSKVCRRAHFLKKMLCFAILKEVLHIHCRNFKSTKTYKEENKNQV